MLTPPPAPAKPVATALLKPPVITPDDAARPDELMAHNDRLEHVQISDANHAGDNTNTDLSVSANTTGPAAKGPGPIVESGAGTENINTKPFRYVEQMPAFNGDVNIFLSEHTRYPEAAREDGIQGQVKVQFVVNEDGSVSDATVVKGAAAMLNAEALRVISSMPRWRPGKQDGKPVKVYFYLPISFTLD